MSVPVPDGSDRTIVDWLDHLYATFDSGWLTTFSVDRTSGKRHTDWSPVDDYDAFAEAAMERAATSCVWFGVATRAEPLPDGRRGGTEDCDALPGLWLDIDVAGPNHRTANALPPDRAAAHRLLHGFPIPPTAIVDTGGGLQAWWLFAEPLTVNDGARRLLDRWGATWTALADGLGWHLDNVFDPARIMRLPGTHNRKNDPTPVALVEAHWDRRFGVDDLDQWLQDPPAPAQATGERVPYIGPTRPGDAFNAQHHASELLAAAGWTHARTDRNGDQHWTRPGKEVREGTSATIYADDGHTTIWSDEVLGRWPTLQVRRPYDPFGLYAHINHRGDWRAASDELEVRGYGSKARPDSDLQLVGHGEAPLVDEATVGSSWRRTDLAEIVAGLQAGTLSQPKPTLGRFPGGGALFYPGRINGLYGEPNKGKTWIALAVAAEVLTDGGSVAWIDLEEPAPGIVTRLLDLGVGGDAIVERFAHFAPEETIRHAAAMSVELDALAPALVVIDSTGEALALEGAGPNNDDEVAGWFRTWPRWIANKTGAAVVVIDHVVKDESTRGLWPGGSQRKKAAINGAAFMATPIKELGRGHEGRLKLVTSKDRHGHHRPATKAGEFVLDARTAGALQWRLEPAEQLAEGETFRPTGLMERVSHYLEQQDEPVSGRSVEQGVKGKGQYVRQALAQLVEEGYVQVQIEDRLHLHTLVRAYRELSEIVGPEGVEKE